MLNDSDFEDIRPYSDSEIPAAMHRIAYSDVFTLLASFVYPDQPLNEVRQRVEAFKSIHEFQFDTMYKVNEQIIARTMTQFTCGGIEHLCPDEAYLYISNHRDIMLDSCLMQFYLANNGFETTQITFGANLMTHPVVIDVGKSNKMFRVERPGGSMREFYQSSLHLSQYIRQVITQQGESVWMAQRNGRTKDGIDATDQGVIKMLTMSESTDKIKALADLHIVPVAISYEWESCDVLKTLELYESQFMRYTKKPGEDVNSILTGIMQPKGRVHLQMCQPITIDELMAFENQTSIVYNRSVARLLDQRINSAYRLYPNNYIAHDLLYGNTRYKGMYTPQQREEFLQKMSRLDRYDAFNIERLRELYLGIYANPVDRK